MIDEKPGESYEVVVVGAGPVGLSTALFLADLGVRVLVVDRRDSLSATPRASTSQRTLELFRSIGLGACLDRMAWDGPRPLSTLVKDSAVGAVLHRATPSEAYAQRLDTCGPVGGRRVMTQYEVQRIALEELRRRGGEVRFGVELVDATADAQAVRAQVTDVDTGRPGRLVSRYLVGADGARSRVRSLFDMDMPERKVAARLNTAFFRAELGRLLPESSTYSCFVRNEHVQCTLFAKGAAGDRWSSHIIDYPGKPDRMAPLTPERTLGLLRAAIGDDTLPIDLTECDAWEATFGIASAFRLDRVFLVGDAAHLQSSAGGLGMNTGIQDGHNLAWKLAAVLRGRAGAALLDSFEPERRTAAEASLALSYRMHGAYRAQRLPTELAEDYLRGMMFYRYTSGAVLAEDDTEPDVLDDRATPGRRLPHRWLADDDTQLSTLDLIGTDWTLLAGPRGAGWLEVGHGLGVRQVTTAMVDGDESVFTDLAGTEPDGALLVRPDGFVAWRSPRRAEDPDGAVRRALRTLCGRG
jgi:2-polyprenyl-6-methoxyphenol hydroxylase-like FAD-dependent oxidoreductase